MTWFRTEEVARALELKTMQFSLFSVVFLKHQLSLEEYGRTSAILPLVYSPVRCIQQYYAVGGQFAIPPRQCLEAVPQLSYWATRSAPSAPHILHRQLEILFLPVLSTSLEPSQLDPLGQPPTLAYAYPTARISGELTPVTM